jgi:hypothetical protein
MNTASIPLNSVEDHPITFQTSINRRYPAQKLRMPPEEKRWAGYNASFRPEEHNLRSLLAEIQQGYSFTCILGTCAGLHCGGWCTAEACKDIPNHCGRPPGYRVNRHFISAQSIPMDFDTGDERSTFEYLLADPFIRQFGAFLYTTLSHTPEHPKARVMFITDLPFTDAADYRWAKLALIAKFPGTDTSVKDPARFFYGTHPETGETEYLGNILPLEVVNQLVAELPPPPPEPVAPLLEGSPLLPLAAAQRYVNGAIRHELDRVASQVEGTGERHPALLIAAIKLESLRQSLWIPAEVRQAIDPPGLLLKAAEENGYISRYGEATARRVISDGRSYATPRPAPERKVYWPQPRRKFPAKPKTKVSKEGHPHKVYFLDVQVSL